MTNKLTPAQRDRAAGVLLATAAGDALGAGYEFGPPLPDSQAVVMAGGGAFDWEPGEWTDDTSMALVIAQVAADGGDLREVAAQDQVARGWVAWAEQSKDVGNQTRAVFGDAQRSARADTDGSVTDGDGSITAAHLLAASEKHHELAGQSAGNGSLMRTAPVALAYLRDETGLIDAATQLSKMTHWEDDADQACVLWCLAIRHAVLTGELDIRYGLEALPAGSRQRWADRLQEAEAKRPRDFVNNGWVVQALQGAWSAIASMAQLVGPADAPAAPAAPADSAFRAQRLQLGLEAAVRGGRDADTVAAIAGGLLGAVYGASAVPAEWREIMHGWPGLRSDGLVQLALRITDHGL